jgi:hypothetical protein
MLRGPGITQLAASARWQELLGRFATASLADAEDFAPSDRIDTKFVLSAGALWSILARLAEHYRVLDVDGMRFTTYRTQYFDTESFALFRRHHAGGSNRYKVRTRTYLNTGLSFVEVKRKTRTGATSKLRLETPQFELELREDARAFIDAHCPHPASSFGPSLRNRFDRICLISKEHRERLTIDLDVAVETPERSMLIENVAVAELKQERRSGVRQRSAFAQAMRAEHERPSGFSKYCMGLLLTRPEIKHNLFMPQLKRLRRVMGEPNVA